MTITTTTDIHTTPAIGLGDFTGWSDERLSFTYEVLFGLPNRRDGDILMVANAIGEELLRRWIAVREPAAA